MSPGALGVLGKFIIVLFVVLLSTDLSTESPPGTAQMPTSPPGLKLCVRLFLASYLEIPPDCVS